MQVVETPILIRHGIECQPLLLNNDTGQVQAFLLENVPNEFVDLLPKDVFLKIKDGRYISIKPVEASLWGSIFPGVKTQFSEPKELDAPSAGKTIAVPPDVQDTVNSFTDDQLAVLVHSVNSSGYVSSFDVYRYSATRGMIGKDFVPPILETAAKGLLEGNPSALHLIAFLNLLYENTGREERISIDCTKILSIMAEEGRYDDDLVGVLPKFFSKTVRLWAYLDKELFQVVVYNSSIKRVRFENFSCLQECFRYVIEQKFVNGCNSNQERVLRESIHEVETRWPEAFSFDELKRKVPLDEDAETFFEMDNGTRVVFSSGVEDEDSYFLIADHASRRIQKLTPEGALSIKTKAYSWIDSPKVNDKSFFYLIWGGETHVKDQMDGLLVYPSIQHVDVLEVSEACERRRTVDNLFWVPLYESVNTGDYTLAQRIYLSVLYELVTPGFITCSQTSETAANFLGAVTLLQQIVLENKCNEIEQLHVCVKQSLIDMQVIKEHPLVSIKTSLLTRGQGILRDLQCNSFRVQQELFRLWADESYTQQNLQARMSFNWPHETCWWAYGFDLLIDENGWYAERNQFKLLSGYRSKSELIEALLSFVVNKRVKHLKPSLSSEESAWYLSRHGVRYELLTGTEGLEESLVPIDVFLNRPTRKKYIWPESTLSQEEFGLGEFVDDTTEGFYGDAAGAFETLHKVTGLTYSQLSFEGKLGIHVTGTIAEPHIALWTDEVYEVAEIGDIAYAWGAILYFYLSKAHCLPSYSERLYFPESENKSLQNLFDSIGLRTQKRVPSAVLYDYQQELMQELKNEGVQLSDSIGELDEEAYTSLLSTIAISDDELSEDWLKRLKILRTNWDSVRKFPQYFGLSKFTLSSREQCLTREDIALCQGASLFSRAFESYVEDCSLLQGDRNDLLVYGTKNEDRAGNLVYPDGIERFRIKCAFDRFFGVSDNKCNTHG